MAVTAHNGRSRRGRRPGWDDSFKRTRYGYPSTSARLAMQAASSRRARNRVVGSKLTHNATLGYISRGTARRSGLDDPGWTRYLPIAIAGLVLIGILAGIGYAGHGENLGKFMGMFRRESLASSATGVVRGAQGQTGVASSRAIVAAASSYADAQAAGTDDGDTENAATQTTVATGDDSAGEGAASQADGSASADGTP